MTKSFISFPHQNLRALVQSASALLRQPKPQLRKRNELKQLLDPLLVEVLTAHCPQDNCPEVNSEVYRYLEHYLPQEEAPKDIYRAAIDAAVDMASDFKDEMQKIEFADADADSALGGADADADAAYSLNLPDAESELQLQETVFAADDDSTLCHGSYDLLGESFVQDHQGEAEVSAAKNRTRDRRKLILDSTPQKSGKSAAPAKQQALTALQDSLLTASNFRPVPFSALQERDDDRYFLSAEYQKWIVDSSALPEMWDLLELPDESAVQDKLNDWEMLFVPDDGGLQKMAPDWSYPDLSAEELTQEAQANKPPLEEVTWRAENFTAQVVAPESGRPHFYMAWPQPHKESEAVIPATMELRSNPDISQLQQLCVTFPDKDTVATMPTSEMQTTFAPYLRRKATQQLPSRHGKHYQHRSGGSRARAKSVGHSR